MKEGDLLKILGAMVQIVSKQQAQIQALRYAERVSAERCAKVETMLLSISSLLTDQERQDRLQADLEVAPSLPSDQ